MEHIRLRLVRYNGAKLAPYLPLEVDEPCPVTRRYGDAVFTVDFAEALQPNEEADTVEVRGKAVCEDVVSLDWTKIKRLVFRSALNLYLVAPTVDIRTEFYDCNLEGVRLPKWCAIHNCTADEFVDVSNAEDVILPANRNRMGMTFYSKFLDGKKLRKLRIGMFRTTNVVYTFNHVEKVVLDWHVYTEDLNTEWFKNQEKDFKTNQKNVELVIVVHTATAPPTARVVTVVSQLPKRLKKCVDDFFTDNIK